MPKPTPYRVYVRESTMATTVALKNDPQWLFHGAGIYCKNFDTQWEAEEFAHDLRAMGIQYSDNFTIKEYI